MGSNRQMLKYAYNQSGKRAFKAKRVDLHLPVKRTGPMMLLVVRQSDKYAICPTGSHATNLSCKLSVTDVPQYD